MAAAMLRPLLVAIFLHLVHSAAAASSFSCGYTSIFNFGDSLADTGNLAITEASISPAARPPYGMTYFHHPTGRYSDGRLVIDFIAEAMGLPYLPPYLAGSEGHLDFRRGVNFAVAGATALDNDFLVEKGFEIDWTNVSLGTEINWFKQLLPSICPNSKSQGEECETIRKSLFIMGEIGGNDYNNPFLKGKTLEETQSLVPDVIKTISSAIEELIGLGARTLVVPGNLPIGCSAVYLARFSTPEEKDYDPSTGCINWLNQFSEYHNRLLQDELHRLQRSHPSANIIYADYYKAAMRFYQNPGKFGFRSTLVECCGGGGGKCGSAGVKLCNDPSKFVSWDGIHLTEAAYRVMAGSLIEGSDTVPPVTGLCPNMIRKPGGVATAM